MLRQKGGVLTGGTLSSQLACLYCMLHEHYWISQAGSAVPRGPDVWQVLKTTVCSRILGIMGPPFLIS